jgi:predicted phosphodiesterase
LKYFLLTLLAISFIPILLASCLNHPDAERFNDHQIGIEEYEQVTIEVSQGPLIRIGSEFYSRVQAPKIDLSFQSTNPESVTVAIHLSNMRRDSLPKLNPDRGTLTRLGGDTVTYSVVIAPNENVSVELDNYPARSHYRFGVVGDVQSNRVAGRMLAEVARNYNLDFFVVVGDLVNQPENKEWGWALDFVKQFAVPVYVVVGNHELFGDGYRKYRQHFGRTNYQFSLANDLFLMLDVADQSPSREVYNYAESLLENDTYDHKYVFTHVTPVDQYGNRNNGFASSFHAARFMNMLQRNNLDMMFSGHIHSYQEYRVEGVQYYVVGTGGGIQEKLDGIECRFLVVEKKGNGIQVEKVDVPCPVYPF